MAQSEAVTSMVNAKARKIIAEADETGEPVFVLRAKDIFSVMLVTQYAETIEKYGPQDHEFGEAIHDQLNHMRNWQQANPSRVRYPD